MSGRDAERGLQHFGREARAAHAEQHDVGDAVRADLGGEALEVGAVLRIASCAWSQPSRFAIAARTAGSALQSVVSSAHSRLPASTQLPGGVSAASATVSSSSPMLRALERQHLLEPAAVPLGAGEVRVQERAA